MKSAIQVQVQEMAHGGVSSQSSSLTSSAGTAHAVPAANKRRGNTRRNERVNVKRKNLQTTKNMNDDGAQALKNERRFAERGKMEVYHRAGRRWKGRGGGVCDGTHGVRDAGGVVALRGSAPVFGPIGMEDPRLIRCR